MPRATSSKTASTRPSSRPASPKKGSRGSKFTSAQEKVSERRRDQIEEDPLESADDLGTAPTTEVDTDGAANAEPGDEDEDDENANTEDREGQTVSSDEDLLISELTSASHNVE
jgi:hypothetical protein